jgi:hypothetical protein
MAGRLFKPGLRVELAGVAITNAPQPLSLTGQPVAPDVRFRVRKSMAATPDSCEIEIDGLGPDSRSRIGTLWSSTGSARLVLDVGYDGSLSRLFAGDVRELRVPQRSGTVVAVADDGGDAISEAPFNVSTIGCTTAQLVDLALLALETYGGQVIGRHPSVAAVLATAPTAALIYTAVHVGKARDLLDEAARILGCRWWIRDNLLYFARRNVPTDRLAVLLPRTHWLAEPAEDKDGGMRVETLLDPRCQPGRQVTLQGRTTPWSLDPLVVRAGDYAGDTGAASPWSAGLSCRRVG